MLQWLRSNVGCGMIFGRESKRRDAYRAHGAPIVDAVLSATLQVLAEVGVEALSVEQVAARAGVNKTSVYRRWPSREALVIAALERVLVSASQYIPDTGTLRGDLLALLTPVCALLASDLGRALLHAATSKSVADGVTRLAQKQIRSGAKPLRQMFARAATRGEVRKEASPRLVLGMLVGAILHRVLLEQAAPNEKWLKELLAVAELGMLPQRR
jgi:AcrR family transcriptional regulator